MPKATLVCPFYRNVSMLTHQLEVWEQYPEGLDIIVVDDGSPEPALPLVKASKRTDIKVFRIEKDIPWNRGGARNLGSRMADTKWLIHIDIDHVLPPECVPALLDYRADAKQFYRFERFRRGMADETRKKDALDPKVTYGPIKPHGDSYMVAHDMYWRVGGYDEDYSGCLGGGSPFLKQLEAAAKPSVLPPSIHLEVYTRSVIADASDFSLNRDTSEYSRRRKAKESLHNTQAKNPLRFTWSRVL